MSKIGTEVIVGQIFKPIITTFTYDELENYRENDISIGINNALIFSIPQTTLDNDTSVDSYNNTSIWATDNSGFLCPLSFPRQLFEDVRDSLNAYRENTDAKKIVYVGWTKQKGTSEAGITPNINIKVEVKYANEKTALLNVTGIKVYKDAKFIEEYVTVVAGGETINWYDRPGVYYLQGLVTDLSTGGIMATTNDLALEWTITEINMQTPECSSNVIVHDNEHYAEIILSANVTGIFEITYHSEGNLDTNFGKINKNNGKTTFRLFNDSYNTITPIIDYTFTPDNTKYYISTDDSLTIPSIEGIPEPHNYYWYAGEVPITASTMPGGNNWHEITDNPTKIVTGELSNPIKIFWVIAVPVKFNITKVSNGEDITDIYNIDYVTTADGVDYITFTQIDKSKKMDVELIQ